MKESTSNGHDELDQRLIRALESAPTPHIPEDFSARLLERLLERLPARPAPSLYVTATPSMATYVGRRVALGTLVLLTALMFWLAPHAFSIGHDTLTAVQLLLCAEFVGVVLWLSPLPNLQR